MKMSTTIFLTLMTMEFKKMRLQSEQASQQLLPYQRGRYTSSASPTERSDAFGIALMVDAEKIRAGKRIAHRTIPYQLSARLETIIIDRLDR